MSELFAWIKFGFGTYLGYRLAKHTVEYFENRNKNAELQ